MGRFESFQWGIWLVAIFLLVVLAGCAPPGGAAVCERSELLDPEGLSPADRDTIDDTTPRLSWTYPSTDCVPEYYEVVVYEGNDHTETRELLRDRTTAVSYTWPADRPLEPGQTYQWLLYAVTTGEDGEPFRGGADGSTFMVGPVCGGSEPMLDPMLLSPSDDAVIDRQEGFPVQWVNPNSCLLNGDYVVEVSPRSNFSAGVMTDTRGHGAVSGTWLWTRYGYVLENCTRYYWRVRADRDSPAESQYSDTWSFFINLPDTLCPLEPLYPEPLPITPMVIPSNDIYCRTGPTTEYPIESVLPEGNQYEIQGRDSSGTAWLILDPAIGRNCWVASDLVEVLGEVDQVDVVIPDPLPTVDCSQYGYDRPGCENNSACWWDSSIPPNGICKNH